VDSFRSLGDLPTRFGFTGPTGGQIFSLPYAEGQLLATLGDDWRRIRCEPQVHTWGGRATVAAPGAGLFTTSILRAGTLPVRVIYYLGDPSVVFSRFDPTGTVIAGTHIVTLLEGAFPLGVSGFLSPTASLLNLVPGGAPHTDPNAFRLGGGVAVQSFGDLFPLILLPGETLGFSPFTANTAYIFNVAWQEIPSQGDVQTSRSESALTP